MVVYREIHPRDLMGIFCEGAVASAVVMFIIAAASIFGWIAAVEEIPSRLAGWMLGLTSHPVLLLLLINVILLAAGTFVETPAALILLVPVITAMLPALHIDPVHLGIIVVTNLAIGNADAPHGHLPHRLRSDLRRSPWRRQPPHLAISGHFD